MKITEETKKAVGNIKYYSETIKRLARQQMDEDTSRGYIVGINPDAGTQRFENLGCLDIACEWIEVYCDNILSNVKNAETLDKLLYLPNEENEV